MGAWHHPVIGQNHGLVSAQFLYRAYRSCQELGARQPKLLQALDLTESQLRDPRGRFSRDLISILCRVTATESGDPNVSHAIGCHMLPSSFSDIGYAALFEKTFGSALQSLLIAQNLGGNRMPCRLERSGKISRLLWEDRSSRSIEITHVVFSLVFHICLLLTNRHFCAVKAVHFAHSKPEGFSDFFDPSGKGHLVPCYFDQTESYIEFHKNIMVLPNRLDNPAIVQTRTRQRNAFKLLGTNEDPLSRLSYNYLVYLLDKPGPNLDAAAETFGMAERTFRRRLVREGASFRKILEQVRQDNCLLYFLEGTRSLSDIAAKLGYSELSAFTRAYSSWYGRPPSRDANLHAVLAA